MRQSRKYTKVFNNWFKKSIFQNINMSKFKIFSQLLPRKLLMNEFCGTRCIIGIGIRFWLVGILTFGIMGATPFFQIERKVLIKYANLVHTIYPFNRPTRIRIAYTIQILHFLHTFKEMNLSVKWNYICLRIKFTILHSILELTNFLSFVASQASIKDIIYFTL